MLDTLKTLFSEKLTLLRAIAIDSNVMHHLVTQWYKISLMKIIRDNYERRAESLVLSLFKAAKLKILIFISICSTHISVDSASGTVTKIASKNYVSNFNNLI